MARPTRSVEFRHGAGSDLDARASGGHVKIDRSIRAQGKHGRHSFRGTLNGGGAPLQLRTSGGSIRVRSS